MPRLHPLLITALLVAAAPAAAMAEPLVRDAQGQACKLMANPVAALKSATPSNRYVCGKIAYSVFDPRLATTRPSVSNKPARLETPRA